MVIFGLTGGTGAGKSSVSQFFREKGIYVIDADLTARRVVEPGTKCLRALCEYFGNEILNADGSLNRRLLAQIAFSDKEKHRILNSITHRYIKEEIEKELEWEKPEIAAIDAAVIIGSSMENMCSFIVSVVAQEDLRIKRITQRDGITKGEAEIRIKAQPDEGFYIKHSKYVIHNNGSYDDMREEAKRVIDEILEEFNIEQNI